MRENKHPNIVNYVDSYLVGEELWVSCNNHVLFNTNVIQKYCKLLIIPAGGKLTSWLDFIYKVRTNKVSDRVEDLNQGPLNFEYSTLNQSATWPLQQVMHCYTVHMRYTY